MIYPTSLCPEAGGCPWSQPQSLRLEWLRVVVWTCAGPGGRALPPRLPAPLQSRITPVGSAKTHTAWCVRAAVAGRGPWAADERAELPQELLASFPSSLVFPGNVEAGPSPGHRSHQGHHPEIQEHPLRHHKARRVQEPGLRHLHSLRRSEGELAAWPAAELRGLAPPRRAGLASLMLLPSCRSKTCPSRPSWQPPRSSKCREKLSQTSRRTHRPPLCRRRARKKR